MRITDSSNFPASTTIAAALVEIEPGGMRELHWHPNGDEWQYYLSGQGRMTVFGSESKARTFDYRAGDVGYVPFAMGHYIENTGRETLTFLEMFKSPRYADISLTQWMALTPHALDQAHTKMDKAQIDGCPRRSTGRARLTQPGTGMDSARRFQHRRTVSMEFVMRSRLALGGAVALALWTGPAAAQVQQMNPNAANESFGLQSQFRTLNQQRVSDFNTLNMQAQRNVQFSPGPVYPGAYGPSDGTGTASGPCAAAAAQHQHLHRLLIPPARDKSRKALSSRPRSVQNRRR